MTRQGKAFDYFTHYRDLITRYAVQDRFHLSGLVYQKGSFNSSTLQQVEGWLLLAGSLIVVFYSSDHDWYRERLRTSLRQEMFDDLDFLCEVNKKYEAIALGECVDHLIPRVDMSIDICPTLEKHISKNHFFPQFGLLSQIIDTWYRRLECVDC